MHHHLRFNVATQYDLKFFLKNWKGRGLMAALATYCPDVTSTTKLSVIILLPTEDCEVIISDCNKDIKFMRDHGYTV